MDKIVNNDGYLLSRLTDIAQQLLNASGQSRWQTNSFRKDGHCL